MPIYIMKRYHRVVPTGSPVWNLGREIAFEATDDAEAITIARNQSIADHAPFGGLTIVFDPAGKRLWETTP